MIPLLDDEISEADLDVEVVRRHGLYEFVQRAWHQVDPYQFIGSWYLKVICDTLEKVTSGEIKRLIIEVPPGSGKSTIASVLWPAWEWTLNPRCRFMVATFSQVLTHRDAGRMRDLVMSPWFVERWGDKVAIDRDSQNTIELFNTTDMGRRVSLTVRGQGTGLHADRQVIDDASNPQDARGAHATEALERTWAWWQGTMASRSADPRTFARVVIGQRLHELDLIGRILNSPEGKEYVVLRFPMEFEIANPGYLDQRTVDGELLDPIRYDREVLAKKKAELGGATYAAQYQQRPAPAGGNIFKREWFRERWRALPSDLISVQSWDLTFGSQRDEADFVAGHIWGYVRGKFYLVDRIYGRFELPECIAAIINWSKKYPNAIGKLVENKANGPAVMQMLKDKIVGLIPVEPKQIGGDKVGRAQAWSPLAEARNVIFPDSSVYPWADEVVESIIAAPFAAHDDDLDAASQGILHLHSRSDSVFYDAMARL